MDSICPSFSAAPLMRHSALASRSAFCSVTKALYSGLPSAPVGVSSPAGGAVGPETVLQQQAAQGTCYAAPDASESSVLLCSFLTTYRR